MIELMMYWSTTIKFVVMKLACWRISKKTALLLSLCTATSINGNIQRLFKTEWLYLEMPCLLQEAFSFEKEFYRRCKNVTHLVFVSIILLVHSVCIVNNNATLKHWHTHWCGLLCVPGYCCKHLYSWGGPGRYVQIDESFLVKSFRGHNLTKQKRWLWGAYDVYAKVGYITFVQQRDAATLLPIIQRIVAPQSTIVSDKWATYDNNSELPQAYVHQPLTQVTILWNQRQAPIWLTWRIIGNMLRPPSNEWMVQSTTCY